MNVTAGDGVYTIGTNSKYSGKFFTDNGYVDTGSSTNWIFEPVAGLTNTYKLKTSGGSYAYAAAGMYNLEMGADPGTNKAYWKLVTADNRDASTGASATNPIEWTHKISNPRFDDNNSGWSGDTPARGGNTSGTNNDVPSWDDFNPCAEHYNKTYDTYQELTGLANGTYAVSVQGFYREGGYAAAAPKHTAGTESLNAILYANTEEQPLMSIFEEAGKASGGGTATTDGISGVFPNDMKGASYFFSAGLYWNTVYVQVTDGTLKFGIKKSTSVGTDWTIFDNFRLQYFGNCTINEARNGLLIAALNEAVTAAQALIDGDAGSAISTTAKDAWQAVVNDNDNSDNAFTEESQFTTAIANIEAANANYQAMAAPYAAFDAMKIKANGLKNQTTAYTDPGTAVSTLESAISTANTAVEAALTADAINTQIENVRKAAFAFLGNVTLNENSTIDITAFITNAGFDDAGNGWTVTSSGAAGYEYSCGEFFEKKFDISQTLTDLPSGKSFKLNVQAFQRPGSIADAYAAFGSSEDKTKNVTSEIYVNTKAQKIKNLMSEYSTTELFNNNTWQNDGNPATNVYIPNCMQGARKYFDTEYADGVNYYENEVAAAADEDGNLTFGFRNSTYVSADWTIFDNFRLYYAGDDLSGFAADLTAVIASVKTAIDGMTMSDNAKTMFKGLADSYEQTYSSATDYTAAISDVNSIETKASRFATALTTKITDNVGEGVFQYNSTTNDNLWDTYSTAVSNVESSSGTTLSEVETFVGNVETAASNYLNQELNAPTSTTHYNLVVATDGHAKNGKAVIIVSGSTSENNPTGYGLNANFAINSNLAQAVTFTQVSGNNYNISFETADGTAYLTYGVTNGSAAGHNNYQIQATTDASKKGEFKIAATTTANVFNIINTKTNSTIACQSEGNIYTEDGNADFTLAEATQATVDVEIDGDVKYATRIFPFTPTLPEGVTAYTCSSSNGATLTLADVSTLAANTPYILYKEDGLTSTDLTGWGVLASLDATTTGWLTGVYADTDAPVGSYVLQYNNDKAGFYQVATGKQPTVGANRCYLSEPAGLRAFFFPNDSGTSGIDAIEALVSGEATIYNAAGAQVPALQKGVNIIKTKSGVTRKVMVK